MNKLTLDDIKQIQLEIMDDVHSFCARNGIRYSLAGGSLLGAVKYKGYVPLDDDIDIMMPRPDYERFVKEYISEENYVQNLAEIDSCRESFSKVFRRGTVLVDPGFKRSTFRVFIDVCPIDGAPIDKMSFFHILKKQIDIVPRICPFYKDIPSNKFFWFVKYLSKRMLTHYYKSCSTLKGEITELLMSNNFDVSPFAGEMLVVNNVNQILPARVFKQYREAEFEGRAYYIIEDYDGYLTSKYQHIGPYMNLPPLSAPVHRYEAYIVND